MSQPPNQPNNPYEYVLRNTSSVERTIVAKILRWAKVKRGTATTFIELEALGFPMRLVHINYSTRLGTVLSDLLTRPARATIFDYYAQTRNALPQNYGGLGIVLALRNSHWVFHDCDLGSEHGEAGVFATINDQVYFFEKLQSLVAKLGPAEEW